MSRWRRDRPLAALPRGLALLLPFATLSAVAAQPAKPNIVLILADDLGYGDLGVLGQNERRAAGNPREPWHLTPQLDQMARQGVQLRHHYCPAPVCAPSRASLLLGVHQGHANVRDNQFDKALENNHTLATVLRQAGYATAAIGKWGLQGGGHLLKDLRLDENTIVVFSSDNGPSQESYLSTEYQPDFFNSFGPFDGIKRDVWEGGLRIPAIARWPGHIPSNRVDNTPSGLWDWMATFADIAGMPAPARSDGVSLVPALTGNGVQTPSNVYIEYFVRGATPAYAEFASSHRGRRRNQMQAVRIGDHMGVRYDMGSAADDFEIYDVAADSKQVRNLARQPEQTDASAAREAGDKMRFAALQQQMKDRVLQSRMPDNAAPRPYDHAPVPSVQVLPVSPGIEWRRFAQSFPWVPEMTTMVPTTGGVADGPVLDLRPRDGDFGVLFIGYLKVPADGDYTFTLSTDSRALFRLHAATVLDADFGYGFAPPSEISARLPLKSGLHPLRLYYASGTSGKPRLDVTWSGPGIAKQPIPARAYFHVANPTMAGTAIAAPDRPRRRK